MNDIGAALLEITVQLLETKGAVVMAAVVAELWRRWRSADKTSRTCHCAVHKRPRRRPSHRAEHGCQTRRRTGR